jgi:hypothetical protein
MRQILMPPPYAQWSINHRRIASDGQLMEGSESAQCAPIQSERKCSHRHSEHEKNVNVWRRLCAHWGPKQLDLTAHRDWSPHYAIPPSSCRTFLYILRIVAFGLIWVIPMTACNALSVEREITLQPDRSTTPTSIERMPDGGYLVVLDTYPPVVTKLDAGGHAEWSFEERGAGSTDVKFRKATADRGGGVIVCGARKGGAMNREELPGVVIRLNGHGQEITRLDPLKAAIEGGPIFGISACIPWGDGYVLVADEKRPAGLPDDYGEMSAWPYRNVILRLRADFSVQWRKPVAVHANPLATTAGPRTLAGGDLIVPGMDRVFRLDGDGIVKARADLPACTWLRTPSPEVRVRFACARLKPPTASTIIEYDESFKILSELPLGDKDVGLPTVCELSDGVLALLGNDGPAGPFIQLYSARGKALAKHRFSTHASEGGINDGVPVGPSELAVVRFTDQGDHFRSIVTWLNTNDSERSH